MNDIARQPLPSHAPACFGCGPENPCGLGLRAWKDGSEVRGEVTFSQHHSGAPMFVHGGAVATAMDDCLGFLIFIVGEPAVTANLQVNYRKPVTMGTRYDLHAWLLGREGRKIRTAMDMRDARGDIVADAEGLFLTVSLEHFTRALPEHWREIARERGLELPW